MALAVTAAFTTTGSAGAATTSSQSGSAACTTDPGDCTFSGDGSASFGGHFDTPAVIIDPTLCPPQATDSTDTICGHFSIEPTVNGVVTASIAFDPENDLDLCAYNAANQIVLDASSNPACSTGTGATESVTFGASGGQHYEVRILPISYPFLGPTPVAPAVYTGVVNFVAGGSGENTGGGTTTATCCHKLDGGGKTASLSTADSRFSVHIDDDRGQNGTTTAKQLKGKVRISSTGCDFRSTSISDVTWDDVNMQATITGMGRYKDTDVDVAFTATANDNGDKHSLIADTFTIDKCTGGGAVVEGGVKYRQDGH